MTGARKQGKKYETRALDYLSGRYGYRFIPAPWLQYLEEGGDRIQWCQPDGIWIDPKKGRIVIVEVKLKHTADAYWQLRWLYLPVLQKIFGTDFSYALVEFTRWYDIAIPFPEQVVLREDIKDAQPGKIQVTIWKP